MTKTLIAEQVAAGYRPMWIDIDLPTCDSSASLKDVSQQLVTETFDAEFCRRF